MAEDTGSSGSFECDGAEFIIRNMRPGEVSTAVRFAAEEGWNPGLYDGECHYSVDPAGWFVAELDGQIVGIVQFSNYDNNFSFGGFLVVKPELRNLGIGDALLRAGLSHTEERICGADGVFEMQDVYARKYGFIFAYRNIRWEGEIEGVKDHRFVRAVDVSFEELLEYDTHHFPAERRTFLEKWISQPESTCLVSKKDDEITGYGMIRRCVSGWKIGPLFAEDEIIAEELFLALCGSVDSGSVKSGPVYFDTPKPNEKAVAIAEKYGMVEVFGTARMYRNEVPELPINNIFGVTSFEMG
jgi:GNAT superfamily N-acetyltransferase